MNVPNCGAWPDESRIVCGQVLAIESATGRHKYAPHTVLSVSDRLYQTGSMNHQAVTAMNKMPTDNSIFWIVKEAHGQKRCKPGDETHCGASTANSAFCL